MYAPPIEALIKALTKLPTVGRRTAERYVFYILKSGKKDAAEIAIALKDLLSDVQSCTTCWRFSDTSPCDICAKTGRDHTTICVVAEPQDMEVIERTGTYQGTYHILRGLMKADHESPHRHLKMQELLDRTKGAKEIILALNPNMAGETTMMYIEKQIKTIAPEVTISRLARGLPMGSDMQYADDITLSSALRHRTTR